MLLFSAQIPLFVLKQGKRKYACNYSIMKLLSKQPIVEFKGVHVCVKYILYIRTCVHKKGVLYLSCEEIIWSKWLQIPMNWVILEDTSDANVEWFQFSSFSTKKHNEVSSTRLYPALPYHLGCNPSLELGWHS